MRNFVPEELKTLLTALWSTVWLHCNWFQLHIHYALQEHRCLAWLNRVLGIVDICLRGFWWILKVYIKLLISLFKLFLKYYPKILGGAARFIALYFVLVYISNNMLEIGQNEQLNELLQNAEWLQNIASKFVNYNLNVFREAYERFCTTPFAENGFLARVTIKVFTNIMEFVNLCLGQ